MDVGILHNSRPMLTDAVNHPGNTPGVPLIKKSGEVLDPACCCGGGKCCNPSPSDTLCATFTFNGATSGDCDGLTGFVVTLTRDPKIYPVATGLFNNEVWEGTNTCGNMEFFIRFYCDLSLGDPPPTGPSAYKLEWTVNGINGCAVTDTAGDAIPDGEQSCDPLLITFTGTDILTFDSNADCGCCDTVIQPDVTIEVTECP